MKSEINSVHDISSVAVYLIIRKPKTAWARSLAAMDRPSTAHMHLADVAKHRGD